MHIEKDGSIIAGGIKIGTASQQDIDRFESEWFVNDTSKDRYTKDDVREELKFLEQKGYFNLPDHHLLNGSPIGAWKELWHKLF